VCLVALAGSLFVAMGASGSAGAPDASGSPRKVVKTREVAPGLVYTKIVERKLPRRTFVLRMDPAHPVTLDVALAESALPASRTLARIVKRSGALAGINGDYSGDGNPIHPLAQDGQLLHTSPQLGSLFAITRDESTVVWGRPQMAITLTDLDEGIAYGVDRWNDGPAAPGEIAGFSPLGGTLEIPPAYACSVRLLPTGGPSLASDTGVDQDFAVETSVCAKEPLPRNGGIVVSAAPATNEAIRLLAIAPGTPMRLHWTLGWAGVFDAVGGAPLMLEDGQPTGVCNSACGRQPRTGIGVTSDGQILLVVVDGRQPRWSLGPTIGEFALIMRDLGAMTALNLDGGGSSEMVVEGEIVNRPSDGRERAISNAVLVLPGEDPGELAG
jgi:hypothetical protein